MRIVVGPSVLHEHPGHADQSVHGHRKAVTQVIVNPSTVEFRRSQMRPGSSKANAMIIANKKVSTKTHKLTATGKTRVQRALRTFAGQSKVSMNSQGTTKRFTIHRSEI